MLLSGVLLDLDQTLIDSQKVEFLRRQRKWNEVYTRIPELTPYSGINDLLDYLNDNDILIVIVTSSPRTYCQKIVEYWGWKIDAIVGYHDTERHKPNSEPILEGCRRLNLPSEQVISVGDSSKDISATNEANICSIAATWGTTEIEELQNSEPDYICHNPQQLKNLIRKFINRSIMLNGNSDDINFDKIHYLYDYYPTRLKKDDKYSQKILQLKENSLNAIEFWYQEIKNLFEGNFAVTIVPSHSSSKDNRDSGIAEVAKKLSKSKIDEVTDLIDVLTRFKTINKLSQGGNREITNHFNSIHVKQKLSESKPILLLDDVTTTGHSLLACKQLLEEAGARPVFCLALTRTVGRSSNNFIQLSNTKEKIDFDDIIQSEETDFETAKEYLDLGIDNGNQGNLEQAIEDFTQAIFLNSQDDQAYYNRGVAYDQQGNLEQAIKDYTQAISLNSQDDKAYYNRGNAYQEQGNLEQAIEDYTQAISLNSQDDKAYNNRGNAYQEQGNLEQAIEDFTQAISLNSQDDKAYNNRGHLYYKQGNLEQAIEDYTQVIKITPNHYNAYYNRGMNFAKKNKLQSAIKDFEKVVKLNSRYADIDNRGK